MLFPWEFFNKLIEKDVLSMMSFKIFPKTSFFSDLFKGKVEKVFRILKTPITFQTA